MQAAVSRQVVVAGGEHARQGECHPVALVVVAVHESHAPHVVAHAVGAHVLGGIAVVVLSIDDALVAVEVGGQQTGLIGHLVGLAHFALGNDVGQREGLRCHRVGAIAVHLLALCGKVCRATLETFPPVVVAVDEVVLGMEEQVGLHGHGLVVGGHDCGRDPVCPSEHQRCAGGHHIARHPL